MLDFFLVGEKKDVFLFFFFLKENVLTLKKEIVESLKKPCLLQTHSERWEGLPKPQYPADF